MKKIFIFVMFLFIFTACSSSHTVQITFEPYGGTLQSLTTQVNSNASYWVPPKPMKTNYVLENWYIDAEFVEVYTPSHLLDHKTLTLYAKYVLYDQQDVHLIEFNSSGGTYIPNQLIAHDELMTQPEAPIKDGYEFLYWQYAISSLTGTVDFELPVTEHMVLEAVYQAKAQYKN